MTDRRTRLPPWVLYLGPWVIMWALLLLGHGLYERLWPLMVLLTMTSALTFLRVTGGYRGRSTIAAVLAMFLYSAVAFYFYPKGLVTGQDGLVCFIGMCAIVWWDRTRYPGLHDGQN